MSNDPAIVQRFLQRGARGIADRFFTRGIERSSNSASTRTAALLRDGAAARREPRRNLLARGPLRADGWCRLVAQVVGPGIAAAHRAGHRSRDLTTATSSCAERVWSPADDIRSSSSISGIAKLDDEQHAGVKTRPA